MSSFVWIPLKKTSEVDLTEPVRSWISSTYSSSDKPEDPQTVDQLQKLRTAAVCRPHERHESSLEPLYRYYDQLTAIESKIPFSTGSVPVFFKWKDAFDKGSLFFGKASLTLASGGLERAAVLFNIGALQSQVACSQALDNDSELKICAKLFQQAAGTFAHLKDSVLGWVGQEPTPDMMPDTLAALSSLMLAQAQETIYIKAARDRMKPETVAKIAAQAAELYGDASRQMNREVLRGLFDRETISSVSGKHTGMIGLSHYYQSLVCHDKKEIGPELTHLDKAKSCCGSGTAATLFAKDLETIERAYTSAKKDNDFIYHERIPDLKALPSIEKRAVAKPIQPSGHLSGSGFRDLFAHLVPIEVQQAVAAYDCRRTEIINGEVARVRESTNVLNGVLASLNLPAALEDAVSAESIPQSMREKSAAVRSAGGGGEINRMLSELPGLLQRNKEILDETGRLLSEEKQSDDQLRAQFKEKWTRLPSERLTEPLWAEVGKYKGILESATNADGIVRNKHQNNLRGIELLSKPEHELVTAIPSMIGGQSGGHPSIQQLQSLLNEVESIRQERGALEKEIKDKASTDDMSNVFLRAMAESGAINEEEVSTESLNAIFAPLRERVSASISKQEPLIQKIQVANSEFSVFIGSKGGERENILKELATAYDTFMELRGNLQEGTKFYNDLTPLLVRLQQKVSDFCFARRTEKEELMRDLQKNIVSGGASGGGTAPTTTSKNQPPSRPPPPSFSSAGAGGSYVPPPANAPQSSAAPTPYPLAGMPAQAGYATYPGAPSGMFPQPPYSQQPGGFGYGGYQQQQSSQYPQMQTQPFYSNPVPYPANAPTPLMPPSGSYNPYAQAQQQFAYPAAHPGQPPNSQNSYGQ